MARTTEIGWAGGTWNVVTGCTRVSPGCAHCYIETTIPFRTTGRRFRRVGNEETTGVVLHPERLERRHNLHPSKLDDPIFVCSLSDLFHPEVPDDFIFRVLDVVEETPERAFLVLTKRPERMRAVVFDWLVARRRDPASRLSARLGWRIERTGSSDEMMPPNLWLGTTIENSRYVDRARILASTPAALRFLSCEPLLGTLYPPLREVDESDSSDASSIQISRMAKREPGSVAYIEQVKRRSRLDLDGIGWVIAGGESGGPTVRPMHPAWARELRDRCARAEIPFWFKQWGSWSPAPTDELLEMAGEYRSIRPDGSGNPTLAATGPDDAIMRYAGHSAKAGGNMLDGRVYEGRPPLPSLRQEALA